MIRLLLLLLYFTATSPRWCTGKDAPVDSMPDSATAEEIAELKIALQLAKVEAKAKAKSLGRGPLVTAKMVEAAQFKARDEAHDRHHARLLDEQVNGPAEMEQLVPVQALLPAGLVLGQQQQQRKAAERSE